MNVIIDLKEDSQTLIVYRPIGTHALMIILINQFKKKHEATGLQL